jgi:hypothetical protein
MSSRTEQAKSLIIDISGAFVNMISQAIDVQPSATKSLIFTAAKGFISTIMMMGRKDLANLPEVRETLTRRDINPPSRLMLGLIQLTLIGMDSADEKTLSLVEENVENIRIRLNEWNKQRQDGENS